MEEDLSTASTQTVYLSNCISVNSICTSEPKWDYIWHDLVHQHILLVSNQTKVIRPNNIECEYRFYILPYTATKYEAPKLFTTQWKLPRNLIAGKLSLDRLLLSIQVSDKSIIVIDTTTANRRWTISIRTKNSPDNAILDNGLIWSVHGGNSADLIILTKMGLELYKISSLRGQCKLSRFITQNSSLFWYNSEFRIILIASPKLSKSTSLVKPPTPPPTTVSDSYHKQILIIDGYILNSERTSLPILELPPPDKIPAFEVGPGINPEQDISVVTLYGKPYCLVRYTEGGLDFIAAYHLHKQKAHRSFCLALDCSTRGVKVSIFDNLLLCHCIGMLSKGDVESSITNNNYQANINSSNNSSSNKRIVNGSNSCNHNHKDTYNNRNINSNCSDNKSTIAGATVIFDFMLGSSETDDNNINHSLRTTTVLFPVLPPIIMVYRSTDDEVEANSYSLSQDADVDSIVECNAGDIRSSSIQSLPNSIRDELHALSNTSDIEDTMNWINHSSSNKNDYRDDSQKNNSHHHHHHQLLPMDELYHCDESCYTITTSATTTRYKYLLSNKLIDEKHNYMYDIKCSIEEIAKTLLISRPKDAILFLQFRYLDYPVYAPITDNTGGNQPLLTSSSSPSSSSSSSQLLSNAHSQTFSKELLLRILYEALLKEQPLEYMKSLISQLMQPYVYHVSSGPQAIGSTHYNRYDSRPLSSSSSYSASTTSRSISTTLSNSFNFSRLNSISNNNNNQLSLRLKSITGSSDNMESIHNSRSSAAEQLMNQPIDEDPIEPFNSTQLFMADISFVCLFIEKRLFCQLANLHLKSNFDTKMISSAITLTMRRDMSSRRTICSQTEILSHVWLPILIHIDQHINIQYLTEVLIYFIIFLNESSIKLISSYSVLLVNLLFHSQQYMELINILKFHLLPDSIELALVILEFSEIIDSQIEREMITYANNSNNNNNNNNNNNYNSSGDDVHSDQLESTTVVSSASLSVMRQVGLDILWRLDERITVLNWLLNHSMILEAIDICKKRNGQWQKWLPPGCISGIDFFIGAVKAMNNTAAVMIPNSSCCGIVDKDNNNKREIISTGANNYNDNDDNNDGTNVVDNDGDRTNDVEEDGDEWEVFHNHASNVFYCLYLFLKEWDPRLLQGSEVRVFQNNYYCIIYIYMYIQFTVYIYSYS